MSATFRFCTDTKQRSQKNFFLSIWKLASLSSFLRISPWYYYSNKERERERDGKRAYMMAWNTHDISCQHRKTWPVLIVMRKQLSTFRLLLPHLEVSKRNTVRVLRLQELDKAPVDALKGRFKNEFLFSSMPAPVQYMIVEWFQVFGRKFPVQLKHTPRCQCTKLAQLFHLPPVGMTLLHSRYHRMHIKCLTGVISVLAMYISSHKLNDSCSSTLLTRRRPSLHSERVLPRLKALICPLHREQTTWTLQNRDHFCWISAASCTHKRFDRQTVLICFHFHSYTARAWWLFSSPNFHRFHRCCYCWWWNRPCRWWAGKTCCKQLESTWEKRSCR